MKYTCMLMASVAAQAALTSTPPAAYVDSMVQSKNLTSKDGVWCGSLDWKTRHWDEKDGEKNVNEVIYSLKPRAKDSGKPFDAADWNGKDFEVFAGPASPRGYVPGNKQSTSSEANSNGGANRADFCKMVVTIKQNGDKWEWAKKDA